MASNSSDFNFLNALQEEWRKTLPRQRNMMLYGFIQRTFPHLSDPYDCCLAVMQIAVKSDKKSVTFRTPGLPYSFLNQFQRWISEQGFKYDAYLTLDIKQRALESALKLESKSWFDLICKVFKFYENGEAFLARINDFLENKQYAMVYSCILGMQLLNYFTLEEVVIPLIAQGKSNVVEDHIHSYPDVQKEVVLLLDQLCNDAQKLQLWREKLPTIPGARLDRLDRHNLFKLVARLAKRFNIPIENCPSLLKKRQRGAFKYLLQKRYVEQTIAGESWDEMAKETVGTDTELQQEFLVDLVCFGEYKEAFKFAKLFGLPTHLWPLSIRGMSEITVDKIEPEASTSTTNNAGPFLELRLGIDDIITVQTESELMDCIKNIIDNYDIVSLDAEWKPCFGFCEPRLALLQLAVWDNVYLFDILALGQTLSPNGWNMLVESIFCNPAILKLGYSIDGDFQVLAKAIPNGEGLKKATSVLDFYVFTRCIAHKYPKLVEANELTESTKETKGLSELCRMMLGYPLDKNEQFSDWEKRPLRTSQMIYAALDAFCLLQVYEELHKRARTLNLDIMSIIEEYIGHCEKKSAFKLTIQPNEENVESDPETIPNTAVPNNSFPPISVKDFRVVVDTMVQGLGKQLRIYGVDTVILEAEDDHEKAAKIAQKENRIILTSGAPYKQLKNYVPEGMCMNVHCGISAYDQAALVFEHYNVQVKESDIFSRCVVCNGGNYLEMPAADLYDLWKRRQQNKTSSEESTASAEPTTSSNVVHYPGGSVDKTTGMINSSQRISLELSENVFDRIALFFICTSCGKVYWEGSHYGRVRRKSGCILSSNDTDRESFYNKASTLLEDEDES